MGVSRSRTEQWFVASAIVQLPELYCIYATGQDLRRIILDAVKEQLIFILLYHEIVIILLHFCSL